VPRFKIAQLYYSDARGLQDEDLADEVGFALLVRIESCLKVTQAVHGNVECPDCGDTVERGPEHQSRWSDAPLTCAACGWQIPWRDYYRSYRRKHLQSSGLLAFLRDFAERYPMARGYREKIILIDTLLHRYHWEIEGQPDAELGGPAAVNLIGGSRNEVIAFLNELTYGKQSTPGLSATRSRWLEKLKKGWWRGRDVDEMTRRHRWQRHDAFREGSDPES
jgi:predicted RNA-binding Zn-ribbon protein involved in translation (DUF1610 family)